MRVRVPTPIPSYGLVRMPLTCWPSFLIHEMGILPSPGSISYREKSPRCWEQTRKGTYNDTQHC